MTRVEKMMCERFLVGMGGKRVRLGVQSKKPTAYPVLVRIGKSVGG